MIQIMETTATVEKGIRRGLLLVGLESPSHKRRYDPQALQQATNLYEGVPIYIDHKDPHKGEKRSARDSFGIATNPRFVPGKGIVADVKYNTRHDFAPVFEGAIDDLEGKTLAFSHHLDAAYAIRDKDGFMRITKIPAVSSVDIVHKGATTNSLFEEEGPAPTGQQEETMDLTKLTIAQLSESRPDLIKGIQEAVQSDQTTQKLITDLKEQVKTLADKNTQLTAENDGLKATKALTERNEKRIKAIAEAELPKELDTETFRSLALSKDTSDEVFTSILEERKTLKSGVLVRSRAAAPGATSSGTPAPGKTETPKDFAARVKGR